MCVLPPGSGADWRPRFCKEDTAMDALHNLVEFYNHLPLDSTYRVVAKGILENLDKMSNVTIYDVEELTSSSRTTVWRAV